MTAPDVDDMWAGIDAQPRARPYPNGLADTNPFNPDIDPDLHHAWNRQQQEDDAQQDAEHQALHAQLAAERLQTATDTALLRQRAQRAAQAVLRAEDAGHQPAPDVLTLAALLGEPDEPIRYRIDHLWPRHGRVVLAAQFKAGKTTLVANLLRALVDDQLFLGKYNAEPAQGAVTVIDTELSRATLRHWYREQNIHTTNQIVMIPARGRTAALDWLDPTTRTQWASRLRAAHTEVLVLDCLGPVLAAFGLDESKSADVGRFLVGFEALLDEAHIDEALVVHHMGHGAERSRGASRLRDWPDAEWKLVREHPEDEDSPGGGDPQPDAQRFFSALGRDVAVPEALLEYDQPSRRLTVRGGTRRETKGSRHVPTVIEWLAANPPASLRAIERALSEVLGRNQVRAALRRAVELGKVCVHPGPRNSDIHQIPAQCAKCAECATAQSSECASAFYRGALNAHSTEIKNREPVAHSKTPPSQPQTQLVACTRCYAPTDNENGLCDRCQPRKDLQ